MFKCLQLFVPNMSLDVCLKKLHLVKVGAFVWYSVKIRVIFGIRFEIWKVDKRATYTKTETFKLYCRVFVFFWDTVYNKKHNMHASITFALLQHKQLSKYKNT